MSDAVIWLER